MKIAIIGRTEMLYKTALLLVSQGHQIEAIFTCKAAPEYQVNENDYRLLAKQIGCDFIYETNLGQKWLLDEYALRDIDVGISVNFINIIPQCFIDIFRLGILNSHAGDLPRYRGNACPNWAIINGENQIALTIHYMIGDLVDAGDIVAQDIIYIDENTYIGDVYDWIREATPGLFSEVLDKLCIDPAFVLKKQSDNPQDALRCYPRIPSDSKLDWNMSAEEIHNLVRASSEPFSGAYTYYKGLRLTIWRSELFEDKENYLAMPGQIADIDIQNNIIVITGDGKIKITCISYDSQIRIKPGLVIRSIRARLGK